ncbi:DNA polymerase III subunit delta' [Vibrio astriarenae]
MTTLYPWIEPLWQQWQPTLEQDKFSQAILLSAQAGMGIDQLVKLLAKTRLCKSSHDEPCGFCHSCDLFDAGTHPDFHKLAPIEVGKSISVDQIRQCQQWAQQSSQLSGVRVIWIDQADAMTESAANALLKSLEEPTESCSYVLSVEKVNQLLPTIISRCQQWSVAIPPHQQAKQWLLNEVGDKELDLALRLAGGSPLNARQLIDDKKVASYHKLEQALLQALEIKTLFAWHDAAKLLSDDYTQGLTWLWYLLTDAQKQLFGIESEGTLPGARRVGELTSSDKLYSQTNALVQLLKQFHDHSGLNRELLTLDWLMAF